MTNGSPKFLFWGLPRYVFERQTIVERVDARAQSSGRTLIATADLHKLLGGQPFVHHFGYVLEDIEAAVFAASISTCDYPICKGMRTPIRSAWQCVSKGVAHTHSFLPRFNQDIFQHGERFQKFGGHSNQPVVRRERLSVLLVGESVAAL